MIGAAGDEATVTAEGVAEGAVDDAIVTRDSPVVDEDDIVVVVDYVIVHEVEFQALEVIWLIICR